MAIRYVVKFRHRYGDPESDIAAFADPQDALTYAEQYLRSAYYMLRIKDTHTLETLTWDQLSYRVHGGLMPKAEGRS